MDVFFPEEYFSGDTLWCCENIPANRSAFEPYREKPRNGFVQENAFYGSKKMNMNKRMIEFWRRRSWNKYENNEGEHEKERCFRHMMNERMRREKQKQSYLALHSMLPMGTKNDKNSIVQIATMKIQQLERYKEELRQQNMELEEILAGGNEEEIKTKWTKIKLKVANPTSGVDSMVEVLNCLKKLGLKARNIHSAFSAQEFSAELEIETKVGATEIEEAMQQTLIEAEWKLRPHFEEA
ncbi:Basic helix-loop-helix transcription factor [Trema orientale]|uniref:Basic helix-loop-helix transcription factor n=1 Tax=Trema orientale TaxID=63057 RepID=A0A2P5ECN6_TREOI|nr:Basic helix-loop-helix transcription factor [Trema orientale]